MTKAGRGCASATGEHEPDVVNSRRELVVSHVTAVAVLAVLPSTLAAGQAASDMANAILGNNDTVLIQAALTYVVFTAALGAALAAVASARFSESRRRICAGWGAKIAITGLAIFVVLFVFLTLSFRQLELADPLTQRQLLARDARNWLPVVTCLTYIAALAWGLLSPAKRVGQRPRLLWSATVAALPGCIAAMWCVWRG